MWNLLRVINKGKCLYCGEFTGDFGEFCSAFIIEFKICLKLFKLRFHGLSFFRQVHEKCNEMPNFVLQIQYCYGMVSAYCFNICPHFVDNLLYRNNTTCFSKDIKPIKVGLSPCKKFDFIYFNESL